MHKQMGIQYPSGKCALLVVLVCSLVPCGEDLHGSASPTPRLAQQGYSPTTKTLLIANIGTGDQEKRSRLAAYDEVSGSIKWVAIPGNRAPIDFAWVPDRAAFVVTDLEEGVTLFQKDTSGNGYTPTRIQGPDGVFFSQCSWSPKGRWLAVNCLDRANVTRGALWLYQFGDKALEKTGLAVDHRPVTWGSDGLLYGTKDSEVLVVELTGGKPKVVRTVPLKRELTLFYGMFGAQPLFLSYDEIKLGDKTVVTLDRSAKFRVMATEKNIFLSVSSKYLGVFNTAGLEIARGNPGRLIKLGSVKDPNTVYGLADSSLVCLSVTKGVLTIQTVADLDNVTKTGSDR